MALAAVKPWWIYVPVAVVVLSVEAGQAARRRRRRRPGPAPRRWHPARWRRSRAATISPGSSPRMRQARRVDVFVTAEVPSGRRRPVRPAGGLGAGRAARPDRGGGARRRSPRNESQRRSAGARVGRTVAASSQPRCSRTSKALLVKSMVWPPSRNDVVGDGGAHSAATSPGGAPPATAVARTRSAASPLRVSMKRRYQASSRAAGDARLSGARAAKRGGRPRVSRDTKARPCTRASARSSGSRSGQDVGHGGEHGQPGSPAGLPVADRRSPRPPARPRQWRRRQARALRAGPEPPWPSPGSGPAPGPLRGGARCGPTGSASGRTTTKTRPRRARPCTPARRRRRGPGCPPRLRSKRAWCQ